MKLKKIFSIMAASLIAAGAMATGMSDSQTTEDNAQVIKATFCIENTSEYVHLCNMETSLEAVSIEGVWQEPTSMCKFSTPGCHEVYFRLKDNTKVPDYAFIYCNYLDRVELPATVTNIGQSAFAGCTSLSSIAINGNIERIDENAFGGCPVSSFVIPDGVKSVEAWTFSGCRALSTLALPASLEEVSWTAFYNCPQLADIIYSGTKEQWKKITEEKIDNDDRTVVHCTDGDVVL